MTNKPFHHGNLRQELIATATETIRQHGVDAVTMRGLSQAIGVSRTAAYRHFDNKRDLLYAVVEERFRALSRVNLDLAEGAAPDALGALGAFGRAYLGFALENPELYRLMFGAEMIDEDRPEAVTAQIDLAYGALMDTFRRGQEQGRIRPGSVFAMASVMWSTMHGLASLLIDGQLPSYVRSHGGKHLPPDAGQNPQAITKMISDLAIDVITQGVAAVPEKPDTP